MPAARPWLEDLDDYVLWLAQVLEESGGYLEGSQDLAVEELVDGVGDRVAIQVPRQHLHVLHDGCRLGFDLMVNARLEVEQYSFDYRRPDGRLVWRFDKHAGHPDVGLCHLHWDPAHPDEVRAADEVDLQDVIRLVQEGWRPG